MTASGVAHHLETGSCPNNPGIDRNTIHKAIRQRDPHGIITHNELEWHGEIETELWDPERAWNGQDYECYLCHREFSALQSLKQHVNSPAHQQKIYHCPNRNCAHSFVSLAAMFNHLESESCGFMRFEKVQQRVAGIFTGRQRLIGFA